MGQMALRQPAESHAEWPVTASLFGFGTTFRDSEGSSAENATHERSTAGLSEHHPLSSGSIHERERMEVNPIVDADQAMTAR